MKCKSCNASIDRDTINPHTEQPEDLCGVCLAVAMTAFAGVQHFGFAGGTRGRIGRHARAVFAGRAVGVPAKCAFRFTQRKYRDAITNPTAAMIDPTISMVRKNGNTAPDD